MTTTQDLLGTITALRQRLEQARNLASDADHAVAAVLERASGAMLAGLGQRIARSAKHQQVLQTALRSVGPAAAGGELPAHLTNRAARLVQQCRALLERLREHANEPFLQDEDQPAAAHYQDTVLLAEVVLRSLQTLPERSTMQLRLCSGVDVLLDLIQQRLTLLEGIVGRSRREDGQLQALASLLRGLHEGIVPSANPFFALAEEIIQEAAEGRPLTITALSWEEPARWIAGHSLSTARVLVRVARADAQWRDNLPQAVAAALVHDAGMLAVPAEVLAQDEPLDGDQRGIVERHCSIGATLLAALGRSHPWLAEAARNHHERLDGTGYPAGLFGDQLSPIAQLLAACDVYAALCAPRPYRAPLDTRDALKETLHQSRRGLLDRGWARLLLRLSWFPAGTAVELDDGSCGVVLTDEEAVGDEDRTARPIVAVLTDAQGAALPQPQLLDLSAWTGRHVRRGLQARERCKLFGSHYPQYVLP